MEERRSANLAPQKDKKTFKMTERVDHSTGLLVTIDYQRFGLTSFV